MTIHVSQTFSSFQGEGPRMGRLAIWLRLFGCNLRCQGFSQPNPTDPTTYIKPISFEPKSIKTLDEFPVLEYGCDTLYAIDPKFKHLRRSMQPKDVVRELQTYLPDNLNWVHPVTCNTIDLAITGGEPLLQQNGISQLLAWLDTDHTDRSVSIRYPSIQFETNGTQELEDSALISMLVNWPSTVTFNISMKLHNVSGEDYRWSADTIKSFAAVGAFQSLKIVVNSSDAAWRELETKLKLLKDDISKLPYDPNYGMIELPSVWIMPVGSTREQQSDTKEIEIITRRALDNGYHISGRLHCNMLGNAVNV